MSNQITPNPSKPSQIVAGLNFPKFVSTFGNIPTSYKDSMTYYETLVWFCRYLEETVIPTLNENGKAVEELQALYIELNSYVDNYFKNLDVQEEINNKLDQMTEDGTLQEIITSYLNSKAVFGFDTVEDMKNASNLINGSYAKTLGYYEKNDGGSSLYKIVNTEPTSYYETLNNGLYAELIIEKFIKPEQVGCYGNGETDDTLKMQIALNLSNETNIPLLLTNDYIITENLTANCHIIGKNGILRTKNNNSRFLNAILVTNDYLEIEGVTFYCGSQVPLTLEDKFTHYNNAILVNNAKNVTIKNCNFRNLYNIFIEAKGNDIETLTIENNYFSSDNKTNIYYSSLLAIENIISNKAIIKIVNNTFNGFEFEKVSDIDSDTNCNAGGMIVSSVRPKTFIIDNNTFEHLGRLGSTSTSSGLSRICVIDFYYNVFNCSITNNKILNCHWLPVRFHGCENTKFENNIVTLAREITECLLVISDGYNSTGELPVGCNNIIINNNVFDNKDYKSAQGIQITGYGKTDNNIFGIYGEINNLKITNNLFTGSSKSPGAVIFYDPSLRECYITNNSLIYMNIATTGIKVADYNYMTSSLPGCDFSNTKVYITGNTIDTLGAPIWTKGTETLNTLYENLEIRINNNNLRNRSGYCIYGPSSTCKIIAIGNIMKGQGGINTIGKAYNNTTLYTASGVGYYNVGTEQNNTSYRDDIL